MNPTKVNKGLSNAYVDNSYFESDKSHSPYSILNVLILPMEPNAAFQQTLFTTGKETSLKQIFSRNVEYWQAAFPKRSSQETHSLSVYRKSLESIEGYSGQQLHILLLKSEGKSRRNPNALPIEQFCGTQFFGPLVVSLNMTVSPYSLHNFKLTDLQILENINRLKGNNRPTPMAITKTTTTTSSSVPKDKESPKKKEVTDSSALNDTFYEMDGNTFYMYRFKTVYCPNIKVKHNWNTCIYAHWIYDYRRPPDSYHYIAEICPLVEPNRGGVCKDGEKCGYSHTCLEKMYHPSRYKSFPCDSIGKGPCPRKTLCPYYHTPQEQRNPVTLKVSESTNQTFLSYAEPKAHCLNIVTNYVSAMIEKKEGKKPILQWSYVSLRRINDADLETRSDDGKESPKHERRRGSLDAPKDYFALFSSEENQENQKPTGIKSIAMGPTGKIFIDDQYVDNTEALGSIDDLGSESKRKMKLICEIGRASCRERVYVLG